MWYGLKVGLSYDEALDIPLGELQSLIAIEQIKHEGAKLKEKYSEQEFFDKVVNEWR